MTLQFLCKGYRAIGNNSVRCSEWLTNTMHYVPHICNSKRSSIIGDCFFVCMWQWGITDTRWKPPVEAWLLPNGTKPDVYRSIFGTTSLMESCTCLTLLLLTAWALHKFREEQLQTTKFGPAHHEENNMWKRRLISRANWCWAFNCAVNKLL